MKFLVDPATQLVKSGSDASSPGFSVSGKIVVDVPSDIAVGSVSSLANLASLKANTLLARHSMSVVKSDELVDSFFVDTALSSRFTTGPNKQTSMLVGGEIVTTSQVFISGTTTRCLLHCSLFKLTSEPQNAFGTRQGPSRLLYEEVPVNSSTVSVKLLDSTGASTLLNFTPDVEQSFVLPGGTSWRLSFTNLTNEVLFLGDWIFLCG